MPPVVPTVKLMTRLALERVARGERPRVPEPMVMDEEESVAAFHTADPILQLPVYRANARALSRLLPSGGRLLDLGSGTGRLLAHLAQARADVTLAGTDLAANMLRTGREWLAGAGLEGRVALHRADMTELPDELAEGVDAVSCIWALHHLPTPDHVRRCLGEIARVRAATGCAVWIFDFARFRRDATFPAFLEFAPDAPARLRADGIASERAAWTADELGGWIAEAGLDVEGGRERRTGWCQAYVAPARDGRPSGHARHWAAPPLDRRVERDIEQLVAGLPAFAELGEAPAQR